MPNLKTVKLWVIAALTTLLGAQTAKAQDAVKISGSMFGDIFYINQSNIDTLNGKYGFLMRRINLTFDKKIEEMVNIRVRLEMESPNVDRTPETKLQPYLKDAFLSYKVGDLKLTFGIQPTIILEIPEKVWGLRPLEKTLLDFQRVVSSRDFGFSVNFKKPIAEINVFVAKGGKNKLNNYFGVKIQPMEGLTVDLSGRYEIINDTTTASLVRPFVAYEMPTFRTGMEFAYYKKGNDEQGFASIFAVKEITRRMEIYLRYDRLMQPNPVADKITYMPLSKLSKANIMYAGISYKIIKNVSIAPNIAYAMYDNRNIANDLYVKLAFNASF